MDNEKIITACKSVLQGFDGLTDDGPCDSERQPCKMEDEVWNRLSGFDDMKPGMDDNTFNKWMAIMHKHGALVFATGYALGQMFDLTGKETLDDLNTVKEMIKEKGLLPYFSREKKAA